MRRPSPAQCAMLIEFLRRQRTEDVGRETTRFRLSQRTLRRISGRRRLRDTFIDELTEELAEFGYLIVPVEDEFAVISIESVTGWPRIAAKRIAETLAKVHHPDEEFNFASLKIIPPAVDGGDDD